MGGSAVVEALRYKLECWFRFPMCHRRNPSSHTMVLVSIQPLSAMSSNISWRVKAAEA